MSRHQAVPAFRRGLSDKTSALVRGIVRGTHRIGELVQNSLVLLPALAAVCCASIAFATNHVVRIEQIMAGANGDSRVQFMEMKLAFATENMWAAQPMVDSTTESRAMLTFHDGTGQQLGVFKFPADPPSNGPGDPDNTGHSVLIATQEFVNLTGLAADVILPQPMIVPLDGMVCFRGNPLNPNRFHVNLCLSYGNFVGPTELDECGGTNGAAAPALPIAGSSPQSLNRAQNLLASFTCFSTPPGNGDFELEAPSPRNSQGQTVTLVATSLERQGENLFTLETFGGNGRTCVTCHAEDDDFGLEPATIASRFASAPQDPLFAAENVVALADLENPCLMRQGNLRGLILENIDGFADSPVFRNSPHLLNIALTAPFGLSGEFANLRDFCQGAIQQHFPKTLARNTDPSMGPLDVRLGTPFELEAMEAFMNSITFPTDGNRDLDRMVNFAVAHGADAAAVQRGRNLFFGVTGSAQCFSCHSGPALSNADGSLAGTAVGTNERFDTGAVDLGVNSDDGCGSGPGDPTTPLPAEANGTRTFSTPPLLGVARTAPFFHDSSVNTLRAAVAFYNLPLFGNSPAGQLMPQPIALTSQNIDDVTAFLEAISLDPSEPTPTPTATATPTPTGTPTLPTPTATLPLAAVVRLTDNATIPTPGASINIELSIDDAAGIEAADFTINYDSAIVTATGIATTAQTTGCSFSLDIATPGQVIIGMPCTPSGSGPLFTIAFQGVAAGLSALTLSSCLLNEGDPACIPINGSVAVLGPTSTATPTATPSTTPAPPHCGDGVQDLFEECDDANVIETDGCTSACTLCGNGITQALTPPLSLSFTWLATSCSGPMDIELTLNGIIALHTLADGGTCTCNPGIQTVQVTDPDVLALLQPGPATFTVELIGNTAPSSKFLSWALATIQDSTSSPRDVVIFDASGGAQQRDANLCNGFENSVAERGPVHSLALQGVLGEQCDDGNLVDGDSCDSNCTPTGCGNGIVTASEQCDDGNIDNNDGCRNDCIQNVCGDGLPNDGVEQCDDGNLVDGDGCDSNCTSTGCPNGIATAGEECDDGNFGNGDGCDNNCTTSRCGNGQAGAPEQCDDGNLVDGDGCDSNCTSTGCPNGVVTAGEECDDGTFGNGDGCDDNCTTSRCGNGIVTAGEQCDDGNTSNNDGCSATCQVERCSDGITQALTPPLSLSFTWLATSCSGPMDIELTLNGIIALHTLADGGTCTCNPGIQTVQVTDPDVLALLQPGPATFTVELIGNTAPSSKFLSWALATIQDSTSSPRDVVIFDASGGAQQRDANLCNGFENSVAERGPVHSLALQGVLGEQCDDGNLVDGDSCDSNCTPTGCGNGIVTAGEVCDDGNLIEGDGCDANCSLQPTFTATNTPTETPIAIESPTPTPTPTPIDTETSTPTGTPTGPHLDLGVGVGRPGGVACMPVTLTDGGGQVVATSNDISFDPGTFAATECTINPLIGQGTGADKQLAPDAIDPGIERVGVFGFNTNLIPDGLLYTCTFAINSEALVGAHPIDNLPGASDADGQDIEPVLGAGGTIVVTNCTGDCNGNSEVTIGEVIKCVNLFLSQPLCNAANPVLSCPVADANLNSAVSIGEVVQCVNRFLNGCV